ncbi:Chaperone protein DnaJ [Porphyridium purpureum]|uniref:Chaperone protein DnaJ n=1 Tax=Porphyridium purpureum TaxID=35688 RepID=A0A5J4YYD1_PORPP|nr:Chaperone protein DnaJ [Porphyridium purpureum]|eukprot:POR5794..scf209_3
MEGTRALLFISGGAPFQASRGSRSSRPHVRAHGDIVCCAAEAEEEQVARGRYHGASSAWGGSFRTHIKDHGNSWRGGVFEYEGWRKSERGRFADGHSTSPRNLAAERERVVDCYQTLQVARDASAAEIRAAYRRMAFLHHPDRTKKEDGSFERILRAFETLSSPFSRRMHDAELDAQSQMQNRQQAARSRSPRGHLASDERPNFEFD